MQSGSSGSDAPDGGAAMQGDSDMPTGWPTAPSAPLRCVAAHGIAPRHGAAPLVVAMLVAAVILGAVRVASAGVSPAPLE